MMSDDRVPVVTAIGTTPRSLGVAILPNCSL